MLETLSILALTAPLFLGYGAAEMAAARPRALGIGLALIVASLCYAGEYFLFQKTSFPPWMRWVSTFVANIEGNKVRPLPLEICYDDNWCLVDNAISFPDGSPSTTMMYGAPPYAASISCYSDDGSLIAFVEIIKAGRPEDPPGPITAVLVKKDRQIVVDLDTIKMSAGHYGGMLHGDFNKLVTQIEDGDILGFANGPTDVVKFNGKKFLTRSVEFGARCEKFLRK
jgi:hypothetical protein